MRMSPGNDLRQHLLEGLEIFFDSLQGASVFGVGEGKLELPSIFSPVIFEPFSGSLDGIALGIEKPLDLQQKLEISLFVQTMAGRGLARLEDFEFGLPETEHVGFNPDDPAGFSDLEIELVRQTRRHRARRP